MSEMEKEMDLKQIDPEELDENELCHMEEEGVASYIFTPFLTIEEAADYLQTKPVKILRMIKNGKLFGIKAGEERYVLRAEILNYLFVQNLRKLYGSLWFYWNDLDG